MADKTPGALRAFHPIVAEWFGSTYGEATKVQEEAWTRIAAGENVLAIAPTGSGKTLAAFLHAISRFATGELAPGGLRVLYVSPLKALNEDVRRNLEVPLEGIAALFKARGLSFPAIRAETRSGDTPQAQRRRFLSKPPEILCTTPESLAILLDSPRARPVLSGVRLVVLDEIHAVAASKRGSLLACSVGRLGLLAGEFQRVALSATLKPPKEACEFVGGLRLERCADGTARYERRDVALVAPEIEKRIEFSVEFPSPSIPAAHDGGMVGGDANRYDAVIPAIAERLKHVRSLLVFTDSRRRAERMAYLLNEREGQGTAYAHHGSLAKEARLVIEERFKAGELRCVVATASLELGIDIGTVDEVVLAGAPPEINAALQRAGRSGHGVGGVSRAVVYPFHGMDLLRAAAVVGRSRRARDVEPLKIPRSPLDILAQVLLSMTADREWKIDELYDTICSFPPFERLSRMLFDTTVDMLAGRFALGGRPGAGSPRLRELEPRVYFDRVSGGIRAREGVRNLLYFSGGAIPDRGHYSMRIKGSGAKIGELDEEFVYERKVGDAFTLGAQSWRIVDIGAEAVEVLPLGETSDFIPFWKAESRFRSPEVSARLLRLVDRLAGEGREEAESLLAAEYRFSKEAARAAVGFLKSQAEWAGPRGHGEAATLPGLARVAIEAYADPTRRGEAHCIVIHTLRGGAVNEALGLALASAYEEAGGLVPEIIADDDFVLLVMPAGEEAAAAEEAGQRVAALLLSLGSRERIEGLIRSRLEGSGLFGAQFRENAGRALLIPRGGPGKRTPFWVTRLKAKRLFDVVSSRPDFPITAETWRSCLVDLFDMDAVCDLVDGIESRRIELSVFGSRLPSPFAKEAIWRETGEFMYRGDALSARASSSVSDRVIEEALRSSRLRPRLDPALVADFERRAKRLLPGWGPQTPFELAEWVKERVLVPLSELGELVGAGAAGLAEELAVDPSVGGRIKRITLIGASEEVLVHAERLAELAAEPESFVAEWLRHEGVVARECIGAVFGLDDEALAALLSELEEEGLVVIDELRRDSGQVEVADSENLEILLRLSRKAARSALPPKPLRCLFGLIARLQGLVPGSAIADSRGLDEAMDALSGYPLPAKLWEREILPLRMARYAPSELDALLSSGQRLWYGGGREEIAFARPDDLELFGLGLAASSLIPAESHPLDFWELKAAQQSDAKGLAQAVWKEAWKGRISSRDYDAVRHGIGNNFGKDLPELDASAEGGTARSPFSQRRVPRALRERWRTGAPVAGQWFSLFLGDEDGKETAGDLRATAAVDALDEEELQAARVRILCRRYGLLFRGLLEREIPQLRWGSLFAAMRRMELRGELVYGRFFEGLEGPQFMSPEAYEQYRKLKDPLESDAGALWLNAVDPAAQVFYLGGEAEGLKPPERLAGNRLCAIKGRVVAVLTRSGGELAFVPGLKDEEVREIALKLGALRERMEKRLAIKTINGAAASPSAYAPYLDDAGFESDRGAMVLW